jgi:hypothetical protein
MSRHDGSFPEYTKIDVSPDEWPLGYWEKARECTGCGFNWPHPHLFEPSPCCNEPTNLIDGTPGLRWPEAVAKLLSVRFERWYDEYNEGVSDEQLPWEDLKTNGDFDEDKAKAEVEQLINQVRH